MSRYTGQMPEIVEQVRSEAQTAKEQRHVTEAPPDIGIVLFPVSLTKDGGSGGSKTTQCSFTYTVKTLDGVSLGTTITPQKQRPALGAMISGGGKIGLAYFDASGALKLYDANETDDVAACP